MSSSPEIPVPPWPKTSRTVRTFARREDAERAREALADHNIEARVEEHYVKPPDGPRGLKESAGEETGISGSGTPRRDGRLPAGCSLRVPPERAAEATRLLLRMPPSGSASRPEPPEAGGGSMARSPLRRRVGPRVPQKSTVPIILAAVLCSGLGIYWVVRQALRGGYRPPAPPDGNPDNIFVREDLDWDGEEDSIREYTPGGQLLSQQEDRNSDGIFEVRWIWQRGQLVYRDRDLDHDGEMDERTTFDGYNEPFYVDLRRGGRGPVVLRRVYREGVLWKILEDRDGDTHFDRIQEFSPEGVIFRDEPLPKGSPENGVPRQEPLPAGPVRESALSLNPAAPSPKKGT